MVVDTTTKQVKPSRLLPAANHKSAGFAAFRAQAQRSKQSRPSGSASVSGSAAPEPPTDTGLKLGPKGIGRSLKNNSLPTRHDPDNNQASTSYSGVLTVPESRGGKKRKLDEMEIIELESDEGSVEVLNSEELRDTGTPNKACTLVRAALAKAVEGEKERLRLETCLRQQITSLENQLEQEKKDHGASKRHIRDLERGLLAAASSMELTNRVIQTTATQLIETRSDVGRKKE